MMMIFWWLFGLLFLVVLITAWLVPAKWSNRNQPSAEEIVRQRYARGEIDRETYERMLGDLRPPDIGQHAAPG